MATVKRTPAANIVALTAEAVGATPEKTVVCLTQNDFNGTTNSTTLETFCGSEVLTGSLGQTLNVAFRRAWDTATDEISEEFFYNAWKNETQIQFTMGPVTPGPKDIVYTGTGYVTSYNQTNAPNAGPLANMTITADEPMDIEVTPGP